MTTTTKTTASGIQVDTFAMKAANGRHIRMATRVTFPDGQVVRFMDRLPKGEAIRQATAQIERGARS